VTFGFSSFDLPMSELEGPFEAKLTLPAQEISTVQASET
jgi:hypothetical protein